MLDTGLRFTVKAESLIVNHRFIFLDRDLGMCPIPTSTHRGACRFGHVDMDESGKLAGFNCLPKETF